MWRVENLDSFEINKIIGAVLGALMLLFFVNLIGEAVFPFRHQLAKEHAGAPPSAAAPAETPAETKAEAAPAAPAAPAALTPGDAGNGAKVFKKCAACHSVDAADGHKIGPNLSGIIGRAVGKAEGFSYSPAMAGHGGAWDDAQLSAYLANPKQFIPGNKMAFAGLKKPQELADVIAYLRAQKAE